MDFLSIQTPKAPSAEFHCADFTWKGKGTGPIGKKLTESRKKGKFGVFSGVSSCFQVFSGVFRCFQVFSGVFRCFQGIFRVVRVFFPISFAGTPFVPLQSALTHHSDQCLCMHVGYGEEVARVCMQHAARPNGSLDGPWSAGQSLRAHCQPPAATPLPVGGRFIGTNSPC